MKVHHLDCCTMHPLGGRLVAGRGSIFERTKLVAHVLVAESSEGLVLVDTGLGTADLASPEQRLGKGFLLAAKPDLDPSQTALHQLERLGFRSSDVRHIVLTHLDLDHAGGLSDFPRAKVHVFRAEHEAAMARETRQEAERYRPAQWAHGVDWALHDVADGERFYGFDRVRAIVEPEVLMLPTSGHSRGHAVVALAHGDGWLVHAGDAYFHHDELADPPRCPAGLSLFQRLVAHDDVARRANQTRLRELKREAGGLVRVFSAHDEEELAAFTNSG